MEENYYIREQQLTTKERDFEKALRPMNFEDFIHTLEGHGLGLLDLSESLEDSRLALLARESADTGRIVIA